MKIFLCIPFILLLIFCNFEKKRKVSVFNNFKIPLKRSLKNNLNLTKIFYLNYLPIYSTKLFNKRNIKYFTHSELSILRSQLYEKNGYDYKYLWKKNFYKEKYGYLIKPDYNKIKLNLIDKNNDKFLLKMMRLNWKNFWVYNSLPVYIGHIIKEVTQKRYNVRYFLSMKEKNSINFNQDNIPDGIRNPKFDIEISSDQWKKLHRRKITFKSLKGFNNQDKLFLVKYWPNKKLKYLIVYKIYGNYLSHQDANHFSLYDKKGILRRSNYLVGDQEMYERDYHYYNNKISKIIEKISQNNQLIRLSCFQLKSAKNQIKKEPLIFYLTKKSVDLKSISSIQEIYIGNYKKENQNVFYFN